MGLHSEAALPPVPPEPDAISRRRAALRWMLRHPRASSYGTALVLLGFFTAVVVSSSARWEPSTKGLPPNQAGYLWCCGATEVAATWEVPQMLPVRAQSAEGVWIGLQTNSGNFFLQVGTQDNQTDFSPTYEGFWSNGPLHGAPENLGTVSPGDVVRAELLLSGGSKWAPTRPSTGRARA